MTIKKIENKNIENQELKDIILSGCKINNSLCSAGYSVQCLFKNCVISGGLYRHCFFIDCEVICKSFPAERCVFINTDLTIKDEEKYNNVYRDTNWTLDDTFWNRLFCHKIFYKRKIENYIRMLKRYIKNTYIKIKK